MTDDLRIGLTELLREAHIEDDAEFIAHRGFRGTTEAVLQSASWQRCRVHFMRNAPSLVLKTTHQMVGATTRTVFAQPDAASARQQWYRVEDGFR